MVPKLQQKRLIKLKLNYRTGSAYIIDYTYIYLLICKIGTHKFISSFIVASDVLICSRFTHGATCNCIGNYRSVLRHFHIELGYLYFYRDCTKEFGQMEDVYIHCGLICARIRKRKRAGRVASYIKFGK